MGKDIVEITFHGRGGQTSITASQLLAQFAYEEGFKDTIAIPIIGAERRGAPIVAFTKVSKEKPIKTYDSVTNPDYILIFDTSLLDIPRVQDTIKEGVTLIADSVTPLDKSKFPKDVKIFIVDDSQIDRKLIATALLKAGVQNEILEAGDGKSAFRGAMNQMRSGAQAGGQIRVRSNGI